VTPPRIRIAPTLANDCYVLLQRLPFSAEVAQCVSGPRDFLQDNRGELRFMVQLVRGYSAALRAPRAPRVRLDAGASTPAPVASDATMWRVARRQASLLR
jgi:hypothetical protein